MDQTQKKNARPSNLNSLISDFESLRQNIRGIQSSDQRIMERIHKSFGEQKFVAGVNSVKTSADHCHSINNDEIESSPTNFRYQVEEVHQVQGIDEAYEIQRLQQLSQNMKRKLEEQASQTNYYRFQVWMLQDILRQHGIRTNEAAPAAQFTRRSSQVPTRQQQTDLIDPSAAAYKFEEAICHFEQRVLTPGMEEMQNYCAMLEDRIEKLANAVEIKVALKCGYLQNKQRFAGEGLLKGKVEELEKELQKKAADIKQVDQNYQSKCNELQKFRGQVNQMMESVRAVSQKKIGDLQSAIQAKETLIRELQEKLRQKAEESPRKKDELARAHKEIERTNRLLTEMNAELEMKEDRLAQRELRLLELQAQLEINEKVKSTVCNELENLKEQHRVSQELKRQEESCGKLEWFPLQNSLFESLEKSRILPNVTEKEIQTDYLYGSELTAETLHRKLQLSEEINLKLQEELSKTKGEDTDRKMYKSVLQPKVQSKLSEVSKLDLRVPRSRRSLIREEEHPNRKSTGSNEGGGAPQSAINTMSKLTGYKEMSLNFSMDEDNPPICADLEEMIAQPDFPFESLKLTNYEATLLLMKMVQIIRCQRDELRQKKRQVDFMRSRTDPTRDLLPTRPDAAVVESDEVQMGDYSDSYSDRNGLKNKSNKKVGQWQLLQYESLQAIERLLEQVESLQAELEKAEQNENNLIQVKEMYKAEIAHLNKMNEDYEVHYKNEVRRLTSMLQDYESSRSLDSVRRVLTELLRLSRSKETDKGREQQIRNYVEVLSELMHLDMTKDTYATADRFE